MRHDSLEPCIVKRNKGLNFSAPLGKIQSPVPTHPNPQTRKGKPHQRQSFDTSRGSWPCCLWRKMIQKLHQLASGSLFLWRPVIDCFQQAHSQRGSGNISSHFYRSTLTGFIPDQCFRVHNGSCPMINNRKAFFSEFEHKHTEWKRQLPFHLHYASILCARRAYQG